MNANIQRGLALVKGGAKRASVAATGLLASGLALADATDATTAITTAKTDALSVAGALVGMGVAIWGAMYLYRKFFK